jgi:hypothetical protein
MRTVQNQTKYRQLEVVATPDASCNHPMAKLDSSSRDWIKDGAVTPRQYIG